MHRLVDSLSLLLLPPRCLLCDAPGAGGLDLCAACAATLPRTGPQCPRCALPLPCDGPCGPCLSAPPPQVRSWAGFRYAPPLDRLLPRLKFHGDLAVARSLGRLLAAQPCPLTAGAYDALLPTPLHATRLRHRGFNQALELARPLARRLEVPLATDLLVRRRATAEQSRLSRRERLRNLRGAFAVHGDVTGLRLLVFDDVITTGATAAAMSRALLAAGATEVAVACVARAE